MPRRLDRFGESEPELPGLDAPRGVVRAEPDKARAERLRARSWLRASQSLPWDGRRAQHWRVVFPQMTNWLSNEEAAQLRFAFEPEMRRLDAA